MNQQQNNNDNDDPVPPNVIIVPEVSDVSEEEDNTNEQPEENQLETEEEEDTEEEKEEEEEEGGGEEEVEEEQEEEDTQEEQEEGGGGGGGDSSDSSYHAPPELGMSEQEEAWAWNLMKWMETEDPNRVARCMEMGGKVPSDYEYSLHAINAKGNKEKADQNVRGMQRYRQKYKIQDTVEEGVRAFQDFIRLQPGFFLHVDAMGFQGSLFVMDMSKLIPVRARASNENLRIHMVFWYYLFQVLAPNFDVLRGGVRFLMEATGVSHRNMDARFDQQLFQELVFHLPIKWNEQRLYNNNQLVNSFVDLIKQFMPVEMKETVTVGCQLEAHQIHDPTGTPVVNGILNAILLPPPPSLTLPQAFLQPNYDVAMQNVNSKVRTLLEERYQNEEKFELFSRASTQLEQQDGSLSGSGSRS